MIGHYLSNNNETCYSSFSPYFSQTKRGLTHEHAWPWLRGKRTTTSFQRSEISCVNFVASINLSHAVVSLMGLFLQFRIWNYVLKKLIASAAVGWAMDGIQEGGSHP